MSLNEPTITITGNLTADPELRFTASGQAVASFTVAQNPRYRDSASGEWKDGDSVYLRCTAWRHVAENICESLQRGDPVIVIGRFRINKYTDKQGEAKQSNDIQVDAVGVSLERHTVRLRRTTRANTADSGGNGGQVADSGQASDTAGVGQDKSKTRAKAGKTAGSGQAADSGQADEPPF
jgi:single-strand DNA-binding protein